MLPERYRRDAEIGAGGMGTVYRAHDNVLSRDVAIKIIDEGRLAGMDRDGFVREAKAAARVQHPNIAVVYDVDPDAGWLVMELVEGRSLRELVRQGAVAPALVAKIAAQVLAALEAAHAAGVIHRDIKPSNIILTAQHTVKLVDFGIARIVDAETTGTSNQSGTPAYMAPEQIRGGTIDARADLYALGVTLYELVVAEKFQGFEASAKVTTDRIARACGREMKLAQVIARCLQTDPDARFASAKEASAALVRGPVQSWWRWIALAAAVVIVSSVAGWWVGHRRHDADPRVARAFLLAQRGENDKALHVLADYLAGHPDDSDAQTIAFLATWWQGTTLDDVQRRIAPLELRPAQRALVQGVELITHRRDAEAIAFLENAAKETPGAVEIEYALGEARWHGQQLENGATTLAQAFALDPRWEMALHHVVEYRLSRGEVDALAPIVEKLHAVDAPAASALECEIAIGHRDYPHAVEIARSALSDKRLDKIPELYICLAQAQALVGDLDGGTASAKTAFELWPLETHDSGGFGQYAEFLLYRGQLDAYLNLTRGRPSSQRALAILMSRPTVPVEVPKPEWPAKRMAPLGAATWLLQQHTLGADASSVYSTYPEPEIRLWGTALAAEARGDHAAAIAALREALAVPQKGDTRMLLAHRLAQLLHESGDTAAAAAACEEVIRPRYYVDYRALLLAECTAWSK